MRAVVTRVRSASVEIGGEIKSSIGQGFLVLLGVHEDDGEAEAVKIADKICGLRVFEDENGKMNRSVRDENGEVLFVSQFTLYGDASHGNRPSFTAAARGEAAEPLYDHAAAALKNLGVLVKKGVFGADMKITQMNDGPVTILLEI